MNKKHILHWLWAGILLALLDVVVFNSFVTNRPIGASTAFPYFASILTGLSDSLYGKIIHNSGRWEVYFLLGALIGAFLSSLLTKDFKVRFTPQLWQKVKGSSPANRAVWAFIGGFLLILGARLAGGCTSGHILSGGMQLAVSSLVFGLIAFGSFLLTGKLFYGRQK